MFLIVAIGIIIWCFFRIPPPDVEPTRPAMAWGIIIAVAVAITTFRFQKRIAVGALTESRSYPIARRMHKVWILFAAFPILAALDAEQMPVIRPIIFWLRHNIIHLYIAVFLIGEAFLSAIDVEKRLLPEPLERER